MLKLPPIIPSTNNDRSLSVKIGRPMISEFHDIFISLTHLTTFNFQLDPTVYEQWRASIHRELEEDLQRQVRELIEESEQQERLVKLQKHHRR